MEIEKLNAILAAHLLWLRGDPKGQRAVLVNQDLRGSDLRDCNLSYSILRGSDLRGSNLSYSNLSYSNLSYSILRGADLRDCNLSYSILRCSDLRGSKNAIRSIVPKKGAFIGFKKVRLSSGGFGICELQIPDDAGRVSFIGSRKCRAEKTLVVALQNVDGSALNDRAVGLNFYEEKPYTEYRVGAVTVADKFDPDSRIECSHGIHFFITRQEAVDFS